MNIYKLGEKIILEIENKRYDVYENLSYIGEFKVGVKRPFLKKETKRSVYKYIRNNLPQIYEELKKKEWFIAEFLLEFEQEQKESDNNNEKRIVMAIDMLTQKVSEMNTNSKLETALIEGIVSKGRELSTEELLKETKVKIDKYIKETYGELPKRIEIIKEDISYTKSGVYHYLFDKILKLVNLSIPVMLTGGAGAGKNHLLSQVADVLGLDFYYTSTITQEYKLTGFIDGSGRYHETEFYKAFTQGGVFMLDEIDASIPDCLVILNGAIANGYFDFPNGREFAHENFKVVCAGNTVGLGADMVYTGRNVIDGATLDRFVLVEINYDREIEKHLCPNEELLNFVYDIRKVLKSNNIHHIVGMRTLKYAYTLLVNGFDKKFIVSSAIVKGMSKDDVRIVNKELKNHGEWKLC